MEKIKKYDFIEIEYTGRIKENDEVFDTTDKAVAEKNELHGHDFGPKIICIGEEHILKGLDKNLEGRDVGNEYEFILKPEEAFGNKNANLIQLIPTNKFKQQKIQPIPGMQLNIDGMFGTIKTVSGGRTLVDFNHPLAGKEVLYKIKVNKKITEDKEKLDACIKLNLGSDFKSEIKESSAEIALKADVPKEVKEELKEKIKEFIPSIKNINFTSKKQENK